MAKYFKDGSFKFGQFIEKQNPIVCRRDFSGLGIASTTHQCHIGELNGESYGSREATKAKKDKDAKKVK